MYDDDRPAGRSRNKSPRAQELCRVITTVPFPMGSPGHAVGKTDRSPSIAQADSNNGECVAGSAQCSANKPAIR
jgi:hypothetical protein